VTAKGKYTPYKIISLASVVLKMFLNTRQKIKLSVIGKLYYLMLKDYYLGCCAFGGHVLDYFYDNCSAFKLRNIN
jgi:hypothetical protein